MQPPSTNDALAASVFSSGLMLGLLRREDVVRWADRRIEEIDQPPLWLIDVSLSQNLHLLDLVSLLKAASACVEPMATCEALFALVPIWSDPAPDEIELLAHRLFLIARHCLQNDWSNPLLRETNSLAEHFELIREGYSSQSKHRAIEDVRDFLRRYRNEDIAPLLAPVTWSPAVPEPLPPSRRQSPSRPVHPIHRAARRLQECLALVRSLFRPD